MKKILLQIVGIGIALLILMIFFSFRVRNFLTPKTITDIILQCSVYAILGMGMTYVIITAGIDLSVGSVMALASVLMAKTLKIEGLGGFAVPLGLGVCVLAGAGCGALNGVIIARGRVAPFICTLGMWGAARGLTLIVTNSQTIGVLPRGFNRIGDSLMGWLPIPVIIAVVTVAVAQMVLLFTRFGRYLYAIGGNEKAARFSGVSVVFHKTMTYVFCGVMVGLAGIIYTARLEAANPNAASGIELDAIASAILGGTSLSGGEGTAIGTLLGAMVISTLRIGLTRMQIDANWQQVIIGVILVGMVLLDQLRKRRVEL